MIITAFNPSTDEWEETYLNLALQPGATSLSVKNNDEFANNDRILIGFMGRENAEIVSISGAVTAGTALSSTPTIFGHDADEPVIRMRYDQVKFYRSTTGIGGAYTLLAAVAMDVDGENQQTTFDDTSGVAGYYYKVSYYNSITTLESTLSDPIPGGGFARNTVGFLMDELERELADQNNLIVDRTEMLGWFNEVNDRLLLKARKPFEWLLTRITMSAQSLNIEIPYPTDANGNNLMWKFDHMDYNYVNPPNSPAIIDPDESSALTIPTNIIYTLRVLALPDFRELAEDQNFEPDDRTQHISMDEALQVFKIFPMPADNLTNQFYLYFYAYITQLTSEGQAFQTPTYQVYKKFALYRFFMKQAANNAQYLQLAQAYRTDYEMEIQLLVHGNRRDVGSPRGFRFGASTRNSYDKNVQPYPGYRKY